MALREQLDAPLKLSGKEKKPESLIKRITTSIRKAIRSVGGILFGKWHVNGTTEMKVEVAHNTESPPQEKANSQEENPEIFKNGIIQIMKGNILKSKAEAIISASSTKAQDDAGLAKAIKTAAGKDLEEDLHQTIIEYGPIPLGKTISKPAKELEKEGIKHIIYTGIIDLDRHKPKATKTDVAKGTCNAIKEAKKLQCRTIALPALGAGMAGLSPEDSAKAMKAGLEAASDAIPGMKIIFVLHDRDLQKEQHLFEAFKKEFTTLPHFLKIITNESGNEYYPKAA